MLTRAAAAAAATFVIVLTRQRHAVQAGQNLRVHDVDAPERHEDAAEALAGESAYVLVASHGFFVSPSVEGFWTTSVLAAGFLIFHSCRVMVPHIQAMRENAKAFAGSSRVVPAFLGLLTPALDTST